MTQLRELGEVRREIANITAEIERTDESLAATQMTTGVDSLRKQLADLRKEKLLLREQETILLASGEHCLPRYLLAELAALLALFLPVMIPANKTCIAFQRLHEVCLPSILSQELQCKAVSV